MSDFKTNFLVTIVFDKDSGIAKQVKTECSLKNEIIKELQHLVKGKEIKHFIVADDEIINNKLKQESVLDKIRAEIEEIIGNHTYDDYDFCSGLICARNIIDKYTKESEDKE